MREVRNQYSVKEYMYTESELALYERPAWIQKLDSDNRKALSFVLMDDEVSNVVSVDGKDRLHKNSYWAFHLDESVRSGLRAALERKLSDFAFNGLPLEKHICEVFDVNEDVVKSHEKFCFAERRLRAFEHEEKWRSHRSFCRYH